MKHQRTAKQEKTLALEKLDAMGQENEADGIKWTKYFMDQFDREQWEKDQLNEQRVERATKFHKREYFRILGKMLDEQAKEMDVPLVFETQGGVTDKGIVLTLKERRTGLTYRRGFKPNGVPKYDYHAITALLMQMQNTVEALMEGRMDKKTTSGILLS